MAGFNGSGTFVRTYNWVTDKSNSVLVTASRFDTEDDGFATGLSTAICKDGQTTTTAAIPFAVGIKINDGSAAAPALAFSGDLDTGFYRIGTNNIGVAASGTQVWDIGTATSSCAGSLVVGGTLALPNNPLSAANGGTGDTGGAWATYTATATGSAATINNSGNAVTTAVQKSIGKTQLFSISTVLGSATVAASAILIDLPATANRAAAFFSWNVTDGLGLAGSIAAAGSKIRITNTDGTQSNMVNKTIAVNGVYEKQ